jgi:hypothetical protein
LLRLPAVVDNVAMDEEPTKAEPPKRKRRWFQFSLRSMLVVVALILSSACDRSTDDAGDHRIAPIDRRDPVIANVDKQLEVPITNRISPVTASLRVEKTDVRRGEDFTLVIDVQMAIGWHIYAMDRRAGAAAPTKIRLQLPKGLETDEIWTSPEPMLSPLLQGEPVFVYEGNAEFRCPVRILRDAPLTRLPVRCAFVYQACDQFSCRPPEDVALETEVHVIP